MRQAIKRKRYLLSFQDLPLSPSWLFSPTSMEEFLGAVGTATLDFGAAPGTNTAAVNITGEGGIRADSTAFAWFMGADTSTNHNAYEHTLAPIIIGLSVTSITPGVGFQITGVSEKRITGQWTVRWTWK
jgi:hypothetical protein